MVKSPAAPGRPRSRDAAGLPAITPDKIIVSAVELTARHGLDGWTLRQLAGEVDAYPAVVYHHVGDRDAVVAAVVDRVVGMLPLPDTRLPWRDWYRALLTDLRTLLHGYHGVARRLPLIGITASAGTLIDGGVRTLQVGGFGDEAPKICWLLFSSACLFISQEDEQHRYAKLKKRNGESLARFRGDADRPGLAALGSELFDMLSDAQRWADYLAEFYDYAVECFLDGAASRLAVLQGRPQERPVHNAARD